jgi:hypothetical protein
MDDNTDLTRALRYADDITDAQARYMDELGKASRQFARQLELLRIQHDAAIAQALGQRGEGANHD